MACGGMISFKKIQVLEKKIFIILKLYLFF